MTHNAEKRKPESTEQLNCESRPCITGDKPNTINPQTTSTFLWKSIRESDREWISVLWVADFLSSQRQPDTCIITINRFLSSCCVAIPPLQRTFDTGPGRRTKDGQHDLSPFKPRYSYYTLITRLTSGVWTLCNHLMFPSHAALERCFDKAHAWLRWLDLCLYIAF